VAREMRSLRCARDDKGVFARPVLWSVARDLRSLRCARDDRSGHCEPRSLGRGNLHVGRSLRFVRDDKGCYCELRSLGVVHDFRSLRCARDDRYIGRVR
jgi:hypothetical protein